MFVTSLGCVPQKPGSFEIFWMYEYHRIFPRLQVIQIKAWKNFDLQSGINAEEKILFCIESHIFAGKEFESK